jgi:hypothetical protein
MVFTFLLKHSEFHKHNRKIKVYYLISLSFLKKKRGKNVFSLEWLNVKLATFKFLFTFENGANGLPRVKISRVYS